MIRIWSIAGIIILTVFLLAFISLSSFSSAAVVFICYLTIVSVMDPQDTERSHMKSHIRKIRAFSEALIKIGPHSQYEDVTHLVVDATSITMETDYAAVFVIDSFTGAIECESTPCVTQDMTNAFLDLYGNAISDPTRHDAWVMSLTSDSRTDQSDAYQVFTDSKIRHIVAAPIQSETNASGALVAFYTESTSYEPECVGVIEAIAAQVSTTISFILALEQSRFLLDDLAGANQELSVQATVDGLTGLANHRTMQQTLSELCSIRNSSQVFSLIMLDVDHFKLYNDNYGHQEGDGVLRRVAKVLSSNLRQGDLAARYGGEEFALILKGVKKDNAVFIAERIRRSLAEQAYRKGSVTVSMGVAQFPEDGNEPGEVIEKADRALYHAKITGRNRVVVWGSQENNIDVDGISSESTDKKTVIIIEELLGSGNATISENIPTGQYTISTVDNLRDALELLRTTAYDIALVSDDSLPNKDVKFLSKITSIHPDMPVILISDNPQITSNTDALRSGASDVLEKSCQSSEIPLIIERNLERRRLERQRMMQKSTGLLLQAIEALVAAIDAKDHHTAGHSTRVCTISMAIADKLNISQEDRYALELAAKLHDVGKLALPESALNKESRLTDDEWQAMREHPVLGSKIVANIDELAYVGTIIRHHHERLDGSGYPDGLQGQAIPYLARIIAVADTYEAMTSKRAHRAQFSAKRAIAELKEQIDTKYSAEIVSTLEQCLYESGEILPSSREDRKTA